MMAAVPVVVVKGARLNALLPEGLVLLHVQFLLHAAHYAKLILIGFYHAVVACVKIVDVGLALLHEILLLLFFIRSYALYNWTDTTALTRIVDVKFIP